jgi:hypothetical protein
MCDDQVQACFNTVPATGNTQCMQWQTHCNDVTDTCSNNTAGPPNKGHDYTAPKSSMSVPAPLGPTTTASGAMASTQQANVPAANHANDPVAVVTTTVFVTAAKRDLPTPVSGADFVRREINYREFIA